jgi:hypothetical protein
MCYGPRDRELEEEARRLRIEESRSRQWREADEARWDGEKEEKPLTENVREVVAGVG